MADLDRVKDQVTAILNAYARDAAGEPEYGSATLGDFARAPEEIEASCYNAAMMVGRAICETDSQPHRASFLTETTLTHAAAIPEHVGDTAIPKITPSTGSALRLQGVRKPANTIESYRINRNNIYGATAHNAAGPGSTASPLAGYYDIVNGIFYFTGFSATMLLAQFTRANVFAKVPDTLEPTIIKLALGLSAKDGDRSDGLFANWYGQGMADLTQIRNGASAFPPVDEALTARNERTA